MTTECPLCSRVEMTRRERMVADLKDLVMRQFAPSPAETFMAGYGRTLAIMMGAAKPEPTWYEKHRQRWEECGDVMELARMSRHVEIG
jgi:hypothetical protein